MILVDLDRVGAARPDRPLFTNLSLSVSAGDRIGLVGINGTGKSTLLRVIAGLAEPEAGVVRRGRGVRIAFLDQHPKLPAGTVRAAVGEGWEAAAIVDRVGMGAMIDADVSTLSGGQAKRVALARTLVAECDLLILDEPTNHLDIAAIAWLEDWLAGYRGGLVLVTHDRHILDRVTTRMVELDRGSCFVHDAGYQTYLDARAQREEQAATAELTRRNLARGELAWLRRGAPARTRKPKARIAAATALVEGRAAPAARAGDLRFKSAGGGRPPAPRLGDKVIRLEAAGHRFDDGPWLFEGFDLDLEPDGRLGIVGANGTGKSTLLDVLGGRRRPARGSVETGSTVRVGYYDQLGRELDSQLRVRDAVAGPHRTPDWEDARLMEQFWFDSDGQWARIATLSGGERRRLQLLLVLAERPNVLLLDEPTNDLDLDTLRALEDFLESWAGSLVVVTHDRAFLERVVTDLIALQGDGRAGRVPGGYDAWAKTLRSSPARHANAGAGRATGKEPVANAPAGPPASAPRAKTRSASTLRRLIAQAEQTMDELGTRRAALVAQLAEAAADYRAVAALSHELAAIDAAINDAEHRWLELCEELGI